MKAVWRRMLAGWWRSRTGQHGGAPVGWPEPSWCLITASGVAPTPSPHPPFPSSPHILHPSPPIQHVGWGVSVTCQHHEYMQTVAESRAKAGAELPTELGDPSVRRFSPDAAEQRASRVCVCV
ncbi:ADP-ribosylation factor 1/2 [Sarotherodon galilaeus]